MSKEETYRFTLFEHEFRESKISSLKKLSLKEFVWQVSLSTIFYLTQSVNKITQNNKIRVSDTYIK